MLFQKLEECRDLSLRCIQTTKQSAGMSQVVPCEPNLQTSSYRANAVNICIDQQGEGDPNPEEEVNPNSTVMLGHLWTSIIPFSSAEEQRNCSTLEKETQTGGRCGLRQEMHQQLVMMRWRSLCLGGENKRCPGNISRGFLVVCGVLELTRAGMYL